MKNLWKTESSIEKIIIYRGMGRPGAPVQPSDSVESAAEITEASIDTILKDGEAELSEVEQEIADVAKPMLAQIPEEYRPAFLAKIDDLDRDANRYRPARGPKFNLEQGLAELREFAVDSYANAQLAELSFKGRGGAKKRAAAMSQAENEFYQKLDSSSAVEPIANDDNYTTEDAEKAEKLAVGADWFYKNKDAVLQSTFEKPGGDRVKLADIVSGKVPWVSGKNGYGPAVGKLFLALAQNSTDLKTVADIQRALAIGEGKDPGIAYTDGIIGPKTLTAFAQNNNPEKAIKQYAALYQNNSAPVVAEMPAPTPMRAPSVMVGELDTASIA